MHYANVCETHAKIYMTTANSNKIMQVYDKPKIDNVSMLLKFRLEF